MELLKFVGGILLPCVLTGLGIGWGLQLRQSANAPARLRGYGWLILTPLVLLGYLYCLL